MKVRLDMVMRLELGDMTPETALDSATPVPESPLQAAQGGQRSAPLQATGSLKAPCTCRFMKLRLDRVMKLELGDMTPETALDSAAPVPEFPPLDRTKWTAPYSPYKPGWWKAFEPATFFSQ